MTTQTIGDMIIAWQDDKQCKVYTKEYANGKASLYTIDGATIEAVVLPTNHNFIILKTAQQTYVRDLNNQPLQEAIHWADYYLEPYTQHFYRKDERGNWYDIEGYRLDAPIFLKGEVLCSLIGKVSKTSISYKNQELLISPHHQLIQVGKLVYNNQLELVQYFGERITGLGTTTISFGEQEIWQEVYLGLNRTAFIQEDTHEAILINNEEVHRHLHTIKRDQLHFEVFQSPTTEYVLDGSTKELYCLEETPVAIDWSTYLKINEQHLALTQLHSNLFFLDIVHKLPFQITTIEESIIQIDPTPIRVEKQLCYNVKTTNQSFVYNATQQQVFSLDGSNIIPSSIEDIKGYKRFLGLAMVEDQPMLFYKKHQEIIRLGETEWTIKEIHSIAKNKLLNAISTEGTPLVIDARKGLNELALAEIEGQKLVEVLDKPYAIGNKILQNVLLESLGGTVPRVINLNAEQLSLFTLPIDLTENPEQGTPSNFAGSPITKINFKESITIEDTAFLKAEFLSFLEQIHPIILQQKNGYPIQLDSVGHHMEIVSSFDENTLQKKYHLGEHRIIGSHTLTEELKEKELLFSITTLSNWLPFYDAFLPIFRRIIELKGTRTWQYYLFELRGIAKTTEYVAVEKKSPYRLFVENRREKPIPKILKSSHKIKILKSPEDTYSIREFFLLDPKYALVGVD